MRSERKPSIRAVSIDLWGTLFLDRPRADERYRRERLTRMAEVLADRGINVSIPSLARGYDESFRRLIRVWRDLQDVPVEHHVRFLLESVDPLLPTWLRPSDMAAVTWAYASPALDAPPVIDPGAAVALATLTARGIGICLVSNVLRTPGLVLRQIITDAGLSDFFAGMVFSDECGVRKPGTEIFRQALTILGVTAQHAAHVGDDPRLDVGGARLSSLQAIQVGGSCPGNDIPDVSIRGLSELPAAVAWLEARRSPERRPLAAILADHASG
ncbi:MAG TPA: HAD family hydrolase [Candidatus Bathyarchaeia archaeon]|nr:HAD family hydrolase [Candidatus Bathyarchaeia archaeon]